MAEATRPTQPTPTPGSHTFEFTITGIERATPEQIERIKNQIIDQIVAALEQPRPQMGAEFSREHHDKGAINI